MAAKNYDEIRQLIIDTLEGRPVGTMIYPEGHQEIDLNILDFANAISNTISTGIVGEAQATTQPIQPSGSNAAYIFQVSPNSTKTFTNFRNSSGNAISVTTNSSQAAIGFLLWNGSYWSAMTVYVSVTSPSFNTVSGDIIQLLNGVNSVYPRTRAEAVFFSNDVNKTLSSLQNQGYKFMGVAEIDTVPETPLQKVFYLATKQGNYLGFNLELNEKKLAIFYYSGSVWWKQVLDVYLFSELRKIDNWTGASRANITFPSEDSVTISSGYLYFIHGGVLSTSYENQSETTYTFSGSSYLCFNVSERTLEVKDTLQYDDIVLLYYDAVKGIRGGLFYSYYQNSIIEANKEELNSLITANKTSIDDINNYSALVGNGGVYRLRLDETKRFSDLGEVIPRNYDGESFAILTEFSAKEVYSISFNSDFQYDLFYHLKEDLASDSFRRRTAAGAWLSGLTVFQNIEWYPNTYTIDDIDRIRIRIRGTYREGGNIQFSDLVADLNPEITTFVDILKPIKLEVDTFMSGVLSAPGFYARGKILADNTQLSEGDVVDYEFSNEDENGHPISDTLVSFFRADNTRAFSLGGEGLNQIITYRGSVRVPAEFNRVIPERNNSPFHLIKFVRRKNANYLYEGVNRAIPKNVLFSGDFTHTAPGSATTTPSIGKYYFTEGNLPEKIYIKCDSVSTEDVKDDVLRIDMYNANDSRQFGRYYRSAIGSWVEIEVPSDTVYISLVAPIQIDLSGSQTITFENIVLSLSPSEKEYVISDKVFIDGISEEKDDLFENEVKKIAQRITELCERPCLAFNILTDTHEKKGDSESERLINQTFKNVRRVSDISFSDGLIHMGDILYPYPNSTPEQIASNPYTDWRKVNEHLDEYVGKLRKLNSRVYVCIGNHDGLYSQQVNEFYTYGSLEKFNERYTVRESFQPWYYFDNEKTKTRVIFLAVPSRDNNPDQEGVFYSIGPNQMQWLAYVALNLPDTWNVLIFSHIHVYDDNFYTGDSSAAVFAALTTAFCTQDAYSNQDYDIDVDFSWRTSGKILAMVSGHTHADGIIEDNSDFSSYDLLFPIITVASSNMLMRGTTSVQHHPNTYTDPTRTKGTVTEELWDTLIYRPDLDKIFMVRFGAGNEREINV